MSAAVEQPLPPDDAALASLAGYTSSLSVESRFDLPGQSNAAAFDAAAHFLDSQEFRLEDNRCGLFPLILESVHNNFSCGISSLSFRYEDDTLFIYVSEGETVNRVAASFGSYTRQNLEYAGESYPTASFARFFPEAGLSYRLELCIHFLTTPFTRLLTLRFSDETVELTADELPSVREATEMLCELAGVTRTEFYRALSHVISGDRIRNRLSSYTVPVVKGSRV